MPDGPRRVPLPNCSDFNLVEKSWEIQVQLMKLSNGYERCVITVAYYVKGDAQCLQSRAPWNSEEFYARAHMSIVQSRVTL